MIAIIHVYDVGMILVMVMIRHMRVCGVHGAVWRSGIYG